jgi:hypothetical protein
MATSSGIPLPMATGRITSTTNNLVKKKHKKHKKDRSQSGEPSGLNTKFEHVPAASFSAAIFQAGETDNIHLEDIDMEEQMRIYESIKQQQQLNNQAEPGAGGNVLEPAPVTSVISPLQLMAERVVSLYC